MNPVLSYGGNVCCTGNAVQGGSFDQRRMEAREDILVFTSDAFKDGTEVSGPITPTLYVSSDAKDTDFTVKVLDVYPDGRAFNLDESIQRMRYRDGYDKPLAWMESGKVYKVTLQPLTTSNYFAAGHKLRVEVSSSNFPRFDRNLNTGGNNYDESKGVVAHNAVQPLKGVSLVDHRDGREARADQLTTAVGRDLRVRPADTLVGPYSYPERLHRVDLRRASRRGEARRQPDGDEQQRRADEGDGIGRVDAEQQRSEQPARGRGEHEADRGAGQRQHHPLAQHHPDDAAALRAERDADSDFARPAGHHVGGDAVDAIAASSRPSAPRLPATAAAIRCGSKPSEAYSSNVCACTTGTFGFIAASSERISAARRRPSAARATIAVRGR